MQGPFDRWVEFVTLGVFFQFQRPALALHLVLSQLCLHRIQPGLETLQYTQLLGFKARRIDQGPEQWLWVKPREPMNARLHALVFGDQGLQCLVLNGRCLRMGIEGGLFQGRLGEVPTQGLVVLQVVFLFASLRLVQGRLGNVDVAALNQGAHLAEEKRQEQGPNVGAVHIGVRHDDNAVVAQLFWVELVDPNSAPERCNEGPDLLRGEHFVKTGLFYIEDFAFQGKNGLKPAIPPLFCRTTGRIPLHEKELGERRILFLAVGKLAR